MKVSNKLEWVEKSRKLVWLKTIGGAIAGILALRIWIPAIAHGASIEVPVFILNFIGIEHCINRIKKLLAPPKERVTIEFQKLGRERKIGLLKTIGGGFLGVLGIRWAVVAALSPLLIFPSLFFSSLFAIMGWIYFVEGISKLHVILKEEKGIIEKAERLSSQNEVKGYRRAWFKTVGGAFVGGIGICALYGAFSVGGYESAEWVLFFPLQLFFAVIGTNWCWQGINELRLFSERKMK